MEPFIENLEHILVNFISLLKFVLEALAALVIFLGLVRTLQVIFVLKAGQFRRQMIVENSLASTRVRIVLGSYLAFALEFQLGSDILATTISPNFVSLGQLGAIALIRTFLNYFLNKELEAEYEQQQRGMKSQDLE